MNPDETQPLRDTIMSLLDQLLEQDRANTTLRKSLRAASIRVEAYDGDRKALSDANFVLRSENKLLRERLQCTELEVAEDGDDIKCAIDAALEAKQDANAAREDFMAMREDLEVAKKEATEARAREMEALKGAEYYEGMVNRMRAQSAPYIFPRPAWVTDEASLWAQVPRLKKFMERSRIMNKSS